MNSAVTLSNFLRIMRVRERVFNALPVLKQMQILNDLLGFTDLDGDAARSIFGQLGVRTRRKKMVLDRLEARKRRETHYDDAGSRWLCCQWCDAWFLSLRSEGKFCSVPCGDAARYRRGLTFE